MRTLKEQIERSVELLKSSGVTFAIAGGMAASVYREEARLTKDVDFIIGGLENLEVVGTNIIQKLGLSAHIARQADLEGGPLFVKKKKSSPSMVIIGRDPEKTDPGVDLLLPSNEWVPRALERAQYNLLNWEFADIATITIEDLIIAKLISSHKPEREQDVLDLRSIIRADNKIDFIYVIARMKELEVTVSRTLEKDLPKELIRASKRIAREKRSS